MCANRQDIYHRPRRIPRNGGWLVCAVVPRTALGVFSSEISLAFVGCSTLHTGVSIPSRETIYSSWGGCGSLHYISVGFSPLTTRGGSGRTRPERIMSGTAKFSREPVSVADRASTNAWHHAAVLVRPDGGKPVNATEGNPQRNWATELSPARRRFGVKGTRLTDAGGNGRKKVLPNVSISR